MVSFGTGATATATDNYSGTTTKALILSAATSAAASAFLFREFVPSSVQDHFFSVFTGLLSRLSKELTIVVEESEGLSPNRMYKAAELYLASDVIPNTSTARRFRVNVPYDDDESTGGDPDNAEVRSDVVQITIDRGEEVIDVYRGVKFLWRVAMRETKGQSGKFFNYPRYLVFFINGSNLGFVCGEFLELKFLLF
jgi:mitochondrial chaperone BCS1